MDDDSDSDDSIFEPDIVKVAVIGGRGCGKTTFINSFYSRRARGDVSFHAPATAAYPCFIGTKNGMRRASLIEFPGNIDINVLIEALGNWRINGILLMYGIDDPTSFRLAAEQYLPAIRAWQSESNSEVAILLVGSKENSRTDSLIIDSLAEQNQAPVTRAQGESLGAELDGFFEIATNVAIERMDAMRFILSRSLSRMNT